MPLRTPERHNSIGNVKHVRPRGQRAREANTHLKGQRAREAGTHLRGQRGREANAHLRRQQTLPGVLQTGGDAGDGLQNQAHELGLGLLGQLVLVGTNLAQRANLRE